MLTAMVSRNDLMNYYNGSDALRAMGNALYHDFSTSRYIRAHGMHPVHMIPMVKQTDVNTVNQLEAAESIFLSKNNSRGFHEIGGGRIRVYRAGGHPDGEFEMIVGPDQIITHDDAGHHSYNSGGKALPQPGHLPIMRGLSRSQQPQQPQLQPQQRQLQRQQLQRQQYSQPNPYALTERNYSPYSQPDPYGQAVSPEMQPPVVRTRWLAFDRDGYTLFREVPVNGYGSERSYGYQTLGNSPPSQQYNYEPSSIQEMDDSEPHENYGPGYVVQPYDAERQYKEQQQSEYDGAYTDDGSSSYQGPASPSTSYSQPAARSPPSRNDYRQYPVPSKSKSKSKPKPEPEPEPEQPTTGRHDIDSAIQQVLQSSSIEQCVSQLEQIGDFLEDLTSDQEDVEAGQAVVDMGCVAKMVKLFNSSSSPKTFVMVVSKVLYHIAYTTRSKMAKIPGIRDTMRLFEKNKSVSQQTILHRLDWIRKSLA